MSLSSADLRKLASKRRSRAALEEVKSDLEGMEDDKASIETWLEKVNAIRASASELLEHQQEMDADLFSEESVDSIIEAVESLEKVLPGDDSIVFGFVEYYDEAISGCDNLETMLENRDYGAEERDEVWGEVTDNLVNMADALDELGSLGAVKPEPETAGDE